MQVNRNPYLIFPPLLKAMNEGIAKANAAGIQIGIFEGYRSPQRQAELYAQGRTAPGKIVTKSQPGFSWHQWGLAVDIAGLVKRQWSWAHDPKSVVGFFPTLKWGGDFGDPPHYEWKNLPPIKDIQGLHVFDVWDRIKI